MYKKIIRPILFKLDPEFVHNLTILAGRFASFTRLSILLRPLFVIKDKKLETSILGIHLDNPIGLAAGFDKNARLTKFIPDIGFGFMEVGSVTAEPCEGNKKPRVHRLVQNEGIVVNFGLSNHGADKIFKRLSKKKFKIPVGISIAKTNDPSIKGKASIEDYVKTFKRMRSIGSYITLNISCPNTGDGKTFEDTILLKMLLKEINLSRKSEKIFLKISPDLDKTKLDKILIIADKYNINGFIVSNLTKNRKGLKQEENLKFPGGISGKYINKKSNLLINYIYKKTNGKFIIIGCGGIFSGKDAYEKIKNGASLIQLITGMIFEGPGIIKKINKELIDLLEKDGYNNIKEAIGKNVL